MRPRFLRPTRCAASRSGARDSARDVELQSRRLLMTHPEPAACERAGGGRRRQSGSAPAREPPAFDFEPQPHWELGPALGILDFERAARMSGARFSVLIGAGARLARALINFMLDLHTREHGYVEVEPPFLVNAAALRGTGNLPKFEQDVFKIARGVGSLPHPDRRGAADEPASRGDPRRPPAAAALHRVYAVLPQRSGVVRRRRPRADSAAPVRQGRARQVHDARASPRRARSADRERREVLERLGLPYRTVVLCTGDMGFASAKTYDIEVWLPSQKTYREISSCSNTEAFQARRANIKYRPDGSGKAEFVHTLNGSGPRRRPHADRDPRELPAAGRIGRRPGPAAGLHGRRGEEWNGDGTSARRDGRVVDGGGLENH